MLEGRNTAAHLRKTVCQMLTVGPPGLALLLSSTAAHGQSATETAFGMLPHDLTPMGMFMSADIVVKAVMIGLIFASVLTWTICFAKAYELWFVRQSLSRAQGSLAAARSLSDADKAASAASRHVALLIGAVEGELRRSPDLRSCLRDGTARSPEDKRRVGVDKAYHRGFAVWLSRTRHRGGPRRVGATLVPDDTPAGDCLAMQREGRR